MRGLGQGLQRQQDSHLHGVPSMVPAGHLITPPHTSPTLRKEQSSYTNSMHPRSQETFINLSQTLEKYGPGSPDGLAIDTNGELWVRCSIGMQWCISMARQRSQSERWRLQLGSWSIWTLSAGKAIVHMRERCVLC